MNSPASDRNGTRRRVALWASRAGALVFFASMWAACSNGTDTSSSTGSGDPFIGKPCKGPEDCDDKTYCRADDGDCGPGKCHERPASPHGGGTGGDLFCGCDGQIYESVNGGPFGGIDYGKNGRCEVTPGLNWRCGQWLLCGQRPCKEQGAICNPDYACNGHNIFGPDVCLHAEDKGYFCDIVAFDIQSCNDKRLLDVCNGCFMVPCDGDNTHEFTSVTCKEDACQLRTIECIE